MRAPFSCLGMGLLGQPLFQGQETGPTKGIGVDLTFCGAKVLGPKGLEQRDLAVSDGRIGGTGRGVDLGGFWILPGIVDMHGDGFEHHLAPRRGAVTDLGLGLRAAEAEMAVNGITTGILAQFYSWEGGMRGPEFAANMVKALDRTRDERRIDLRVQLRLETRLPGGYDAAETLISQAEIAYVVLNDHVPHDALAAGKKPPRLVGQALKSGRSPEAHWDMLRDLHSQDIKVALSGLAKRLRARGVLLGSHDDPDAETRMDMRNLGASVCEFPETETAASEARLGGDWIIMGAPNVMRGNSHKGKIAAQTLVETGQCDALVSDYHYPSLLQSAFALLDRGVLELHVAWALIAANPARILGLTDRGWLGAGQRADLIVLDPNTRRVEATLSGGKAAYMSSRVAERLLG